MDPGAAGADQDEMSREELHRRTDFGFELTLPSPREENFPFSSPSIHKQGLIFQ